MTEFLLRTFVKDAAKHRRPGRAFGLRQPGLHRGHCVQCPVVFGQVHCGHAVRPACPSPPDAINNLSDASSNIVSLVGFKLGSKPADKKQPYGHARYEYLAGLAVSVMILVIGIELGKES